VPGFDWQDGFQRQRQFNHESKFVVPSWIIGKSPERFAQWAEGQGYSGIAGWEAANPAYSFRSVAQAWPLIVNELEPLPAKSEEEIAEAIKTEECWKLYHAVRAQYGTTVHGLPRFQGTVDLSPFGFGRARFLKCEKGTIWSSGQRTDCMHEGQLEDLAAQGLARFDFQPDTLQGLPYQRNDNPGAWHCVTEGLDKWVTQPEFLSLYLAAGDSALRRYGLPYRGQVGNVQYFERARLELQADGSVGLGRVGAELADATGAQG
jgi:hypothetical protein